MNSFHYSITKWPVPVAAWSKTLVCGRWLAWIAGSKPAGGHGCLSFELFTFAPFMLLYLFYSNQLMPPF